MELFGRKTFLYYGVAFLVLLGRVLCQTTDGTQTMDNKRGNWVKKKFEKYIGWFSNTIGTDMWILVGLAAGATFIFCVVLWIIMSFCYWICSIGSKKR